MAPLIDLEHIIDALQGFKRPLREGREALKNIVVCGIASRTQKEVQVDALCVRTTKISEPPVNIKIIINPSKSVKTEEKIVSLSCSCPSGASKEHSCKHAMACLLYLERNDESEIERLTCTDLEQRWGGMQVEKMREFDPVPLSEFCHIGKVQSPYQRPIKDVTDEMALEFRNLLVKDQPNSEVAIFLSGVRHANRAVESDCIEEDPPAPIVTIVEHAISNGSFVLKTAQELGSSLYAQCTPEEQDYFDKHIKIEDDAVVKICTNTQDQDGDDWLEYKYGRITGSICYSYYTYYKNRKKHSDADWCNKIKATYSSSFSNDSMKDGKEFEGRAQKCYEKKFPDRKINSLGIFINPMTPWLGYSADGVVTVDSNIDRLWEVKSPVKDSTYGADEVCKYLAYMKDNKLKEKHVYYGQIQLGMLLLSIPICDFTIFCNKPQEENHEVHVDTVVFNEKFCLEMAQNLTHAFFTKVLPWLVSQVE